MALTIYGAAQVKVQNGEALVPGQRVTVGADGAARALGTITVQLAGGEGTADIAEERADPGRRAGSAEGRHGLGAGEPAVGARRVPRKLATLQITRRRGLSVSPRRLPR